MTPTTTTANHSMAFNNAGGTNTIARTNGILAHNTQKTKSDTNTGKLREHRG